MTATLSSMPSVWRDYKGESRTVTTTHLYDELDQSRKETRVIFVHPGKGEEPINCSFESVFLSNDSINPYESISYVWGEVIARGTILVNGHGLDVPLSVERVLKRFRSHDRPRRLWIDAVCINQESTSERNYQVKMMEDIYARAQSGLIWLGVDKDAAAIFDTMRALAQEASLATASFSNFKAMVWPGWWDVYGTPTAVPLNADMIYRLIDCAWFKRLWVVQEAALAPRSTCYLGDARLSLRELLRAIVWLYSKNRTLPYPLAGHTGLARAVHIASYCDPIFKDPFQSKANLLWMLNTLRQYDTTDSKDHLYGLLGMYRRFVGSKKELPPSLRPDYNRSIQDIFSDAARVAMFELKKLDALIYVGHRSDEEVDHPTIPTWVPPWHRKLDVSIDPLPLNHKDFDASRAPWRGPASVTGNNRLLEVDGFLIGDVQGVTDIFEPGLLTSTEGLLRLLNQVERLSVPANQNDIYAALVASCNHKRQIVGAQECAEGYQDLVKSLTTLRVIPSVELSNNASTGSHYVEALSRWTQNRKYFVTKERRLGIGPRTMRQYDSIAIIYGSSWPIVLRQHRNRKTYAVIGQAYVHGVMSGEALVNGPALDQFVLE